MLDDFALTCPERFMPEILLERLFDLFQTFPHTHERLFLFPTLQQPWRPIYPTFTVMFYLNKESPAFPTGSASTTRPHRQDSYSRSHDSHYHYTGWYQGDQRVESFSQAHSYISTSYRGRSSRQRDTPSHIG